MGLIQKFTKGEYALLKAMVDNCGLYVMERRGNGVERLEYVFYRPGDGVSRELLPIEAVMGLMEMGVLEERSEGSGVYKISKVGWLLFKKE